MTSRLRLLAFAALVLGLGARTLPLLLLPDAPLETCDGRAYYVTGVAWAEGRGLFVDDPYLVEVCGEHMAAGPSHHYAPALALVEGAFVRVLGDTPAALVLPLLLLSWAAVAVAWWTTRDLFGGDAGLVVAAAVSLEWSGVVHGTLLGYSENLVVLALTLTLWAILRGLRDDRYTPLAGLFAGIGYLSKASIGWFFIIAGLGGLAYRLMFRGWRVLRNRWYWAAIAIFAVPVVAWSYRNVSLFWDGTLAGLLEAWQTSAHQSAVVSAAFEQPGLLLVGLAGKLPVLAVALGLPFVALAPALHSALRRWREEDVFGLWLAVALIFALGWFFAAAFWVSEQTSLLWADPVRYVTPAQVPLLWLAVRHQERLSTAHWTVFFAVLLLMPLAIVVLLDPGVGLAAASR